LYLHFHPIHKRCFKMTFPFPAIFLTKNTKNTMNTMNAQTTDDDLPSTLDPAKAWELFSFRSWWSARIALVSPNSKESTQRTWPSLEISCALEKQLTLPEPIMHVACWTTTCISMLTLNRLKWIGNELHWGVLDFIWQHADYDNSAAHNDWGWEPQWALEEMCQETAARWQGAN
jgi:hypothetical protein